MKLIKVTAQDIYNELLNKFKIKGKTGSIEIKLGGINSPYDGRDALGDLLQQWISTWLKNKNYFFRTKPNTQEFPDFLLSTSNTKDFLELKTFNSKKSPAFDLASFDSYCKSLLDLPERIDADYLIISYEKLTSGFEIKDLWLKKIWEISGPSEPNPVKIQTKGIVIHNLRPCTWYSSKAQFEPFKSKSDFLQAIADTQQNYNQCIPYRTNWLKNVKAKYLANTGTKL